MKKRNKKKRTIITTIILLLVVSIGYALLNANLNITGTSRFARTTWNIHFENLQDNTNMTLGQNDSAAAITQNKTNEVTYALTFTEPGQFYEFTVDAKNDGTIDGMVNAVTSTIKIGSGEATPITTNPSNLPAYLSYTATYSDGQPIEQYHLLEANQKETYKVRVEFRTDIENTDLPETDETIELSFGVEYIQKDSNAVPVVHPVNGMRYTTNQYDESKPDSNYIRLNQAIPAQITFHETASAAMAEFSNKPFYLKHNISNNTVTESYVEFIVTDEIAQANPGMTAGTYQLRGGINESSLTDQPIFIQNAKTIYDAFGTNCSSNPYTTTITSSLFSCGAGGLRADAYKNGYNRAGDSDGASCYVHDSGLSHCIED